MNTSQPAPSSLEQIKKGINAILETAQSANPHEVVELMKRVVELRFNLAVMTQGMDSPDPRVTWQMSRLDLVKTLLADRLDMFEAERILSDLEVG